MTSNVDVTQPPFGNATTAGVRNNFVTIKAEIEELQGALGYADYNDAATASTPIAVLPNTWTKLKNDTLGANTRLRLPNGVSGLWDAINNQFDFTTVPVDGMLHFRVDLDVTTQSLNQTVELWLVFAIGTANEFNLPVVVDEQYKTVGTYKMLEVMSAYVGNTDTQNYPCELRIRSDDDLTVKVNGWYVKVDIPSGA